MNDRTPPVWVLGRIDADIDLFEARRRAVYLRSLRISFAVAFIMVGWVLWHLLVVRG